MSDSNWAELVIGGFLLGSVLCSAYYIYRARSLYRIAMLMICAGIIISTIFILVDDYLHNIPVWLKAGYLIGYSLMAAGFTIVIKKRRAE